MSQRKIILSPGHRPAVADLPEGNYGLFLKLDHPDWAGVYLDGGRAVCQELIDRWSTDTAHLMTFTYTGTRRFKSYKFKKGQITGAIVSPL